MQEDTTGEPAVHPIVSLALSVLEKGKKEPLILPDKGKTAVAQAYQRLFDKEDLPLAARDLGNLALHLLVNLHAQGAAAALIQITNTALPILTKMKSALAQEAVQKADGASEQIKAFSKKNFAGGGPAGGSGLPDA